MAAPNPKLYEEGTSTLLAEFAFGELAPPETSAEWEFDLANVGATAEDMTEVSIGVEESDDAGVTWHQDGQPSLERWWQVQAYGVDGAGIRAQTTAWTPIGLGARLALNPIPADARRKLRARIVVPGTGVSSASKRFKLVVYWRAAATPLGVGLFEAGIHGFPTGTGDAEATWMIDGGVFTESGTPDNDLQVSTHVWRYEGVPYVKYAHAITIAASAAGQARWVLISLGPGPDLTVTEGDEVAAPAPVNDRPEVPEGHVALAWVHRGDSTIVDADISTEVLLYSPFLAYGYDLSADVGSGKAIVDNMLIRRDQLQTVTLDDDETNILYLLPDGNIEVVPSGTAPTIARAEPMWEFVTAGGTVTGDFRDLRRLIGPERYTFEAFFAGEVAVNDARYFVAPDNRRVCVLLARWDSGAELMAGAMGDHTGGDLELELEQWDGATWTSLFSDATRRPMLAFDDDPLDPAVTRGFLPDTVIVEPGTRLRWRIAVLPTGGATDPSDVTARIVFEEMPL
jgi:hypothetical protein